MKYAKWYFLLISRAQARDSDVVVGERHHIVPRTLGGGNEKSNLVKLTHREHFLCHHLLVKFTCGEDQRKMNHAFGRMSGANTKNGRPKLKGWQYARAKLAIADAMKGREVSPETRTKISEAGKGRSSWNKGKKLSPEQRAKMSAHMMGRKLTAETRAKIAAANKGNTKGKGNKGKMSPEQKAKLSAARIGKKHTAEIKAKIAASHTGKKRAPFTDEHRARLSAAGKGKPAWNKGKSSWNKGKKHTAESRAKMSAARMGNTNASGKRDKPAWNKGKRKGDLHV